ncbi:extracellular solute-binding protein [Mesorhizobium sp. SB112]|uniref:extracellular solute-binding protein n=1 Tax=Mesorhizobium sp. SB112 TaxID=3151853 RepID=UPI00326758F9
MLLNRRNFLKTSLGAGTIAAIGLPAQAQNSPFIVNMFGGRWENDWRNQVMPRFSEKIGRPVNLDIGLGTGWVSTFKAAGPENPPFSAIMLNERYTAMLRDEGYFETLTPELVPNYKDVIEPAKLAGSTAVNGMLAPLVIAYRTDMVKTPPSGWADLWKEEYKGLTGFYAITNSAGIMMAMWAGEHFGSGRDDIDTAVKKFAELKPFPQIGYSSQFTPLITQGQIAIAPLDVGEVKTMQEQGVPVDFVLPEEGMMVFDHSFSILKNGKDKKDAAAYIDFVLSPETQLWMTTNWLIAPTNKTVKLPSELDKWPLQPEQLEKAIRFDWTEANKINKSLTDLWSRTI